MTDDDATSTTPSEAPSEATTYCRDPGDSELDLPAYDNLNLDWVPVRDTTPYCDPAVAGSSKYLCSASFNDREDVGSVG